IDRHRTLREHRGSVKKGPMVLAAVETVTEANPVGEPRRRNSNVAAQATARESVHAASPQSVRETNPSTLSTAPPRRNLDESQRHRACLHPAEVVERLR